jgi:hypothetical protein
MQIITISWSNAISLFYTKVKYREDPIKTYTRLGSGLGAGTTKLFTAVTFAVS